jgi:transketolase
VALILTRQAVPTLDRSWCAPADGLQRGAYILLEARNGRPEVLLLATGSEIALCVEAHRRLEAEGIGTRVVSMPSWELFERYCREHPEYREHVLPSSVPGRVSVESGSTLGWARYVGPAGVALGMETFGASAPLAALQQKFGFTPENIVAAARRVARRET